MALKIWTFLLVMSLPAAERGRCFGSLATVLSAIDYHRIQQKLLHADNKTRLLATPPPWPPSQWKNDVHRVDKRAAPKITNKKHYASTMMMAAASSSGVPSVDGRCMARVQSALGDMMSASAVKNGNRRHTGGPQSSSTGFIDLSGYALHQRLRTAPGAEMYVTGMRAKVVLPQRDAAESSLLSAATASVGVNDDDAAAAGDHRSWALVDGCQYDPLGNTLEARMRFGRMLMVSGSVRLLYGGASPVETGCDMTLRLRPRAGLGFTAVPLTVPEKHPPNRLTATPTMTIRTTATFIDPEPAADDPTATYVSVHSYNCVGGAAAFAAHGNREQAAAASSDRFEQISSAEDGSDESSLLDVVDTNWDDVSAEFGDWRTNRRPSPSPSPSPPPPQQSSSAKTVTAVPTVNSYVDAGFVGTTPGPEPRLRKIQYLGKPSQHPILTAFNGQHSLHQVQDQLLMEMEEVFVRGVRSLLAKHMERALQPVLKDSLMANMGYTVSYG